jgi:hypothetical protein
MEKDDDLEEIRGLTSLYFEYQRRKREIRLWWRQALAEVKPSVTSRALERFERWAQQTAG